MYTSTTSGTGVLVLIYATSTWFVIYLWRVRGDLRNTRLHPRVWGKGWRKGWGYVRNASPRGWGRIPKLGLYAAGPSFQAIQHLVRKLCYMEQKGDGKRTWKMGHHLGLGYFMHTMTWADPRRLFKNGPQIKKNGTHQYAAWLWPKKKSACTHRRGNPSQGDQPNASSKLFHKYGIQWSQLQRVLHQVGFQWASPRQLWKNPKVRQFCKLTAQKSKLLFGGRMNGWGRMGHQKSRMNNAWTPWACVGRTGQRGRFFGAAKGKISMSVPPTFTDEDTCFVVPQNNSWMAVYQHIPLKTISRLWGQFNQLELPVWLRTPAFSLYIWMFGCRLKDAAQEDLRKYRNLSEFFRRQLKPGLRPVDRGHVLTSPADGQVLHFGCVESDLLEQVKGMKYSLQGFMGPPQGLLSNSQSSDNLPNKMATSYSQFLLHQPEHHELYYCVIYLAPGDYHRFHSPTNWTVTARRHFPGNLFSVNPNVASWLHGLFVLNERAVYVGKWRYGFFSMTPVGATNVGSINVTFDKSLETNERAKHPEGSYFDQQFSTRRRSGVLQNQGELMGDFNLGSTVVLLFEAPRKFKFNIQTGQKVKYGQGIGGTGYQALRSSTGRRKNSI